MKINRKTKWILFIIIIISIWIINHKVFIPKREREEYLDNTTETLYKNFKLKINKNDYKAKIFHDTRNLIEPFHYYFLEKKNKNIKYTHFIEKWDKCGRPYFDIGNEHTSFFSKSEIIELIRLLKIYGFGPYFVNEFIYDKSKGNDFEKIEQILSKYEKKYNLSSNTDEYSCISFIKTSKFVSPSILNVDADSEDYYEVLQIEKKFISYFSIERDFDKIDWYEFKKYLDIKPILYFSSNASKEELQKLLEEIKPYYNKNEYIITFSSNKGEDIW